MYINCIFLIKISKNKEKVGNFCSSLQLLMMKENSHFGTLRFPLIMYTILFTYVAHYLLEQQIELVLNTMA